MSIEHKTSKWIFCPVCGNKTRTKVYENTVVTNFPLYCPIAKYNRLRGNYEARKYIEKSDCSIQTRSS